MSDNYELFFRMMGTFMANHPDNLQVLTNIEMEASDKLWPEYTYEMVIATSKLEWKAQDA